MVREKEKKREKKKKKRQLNPKQINDLALRLIVFHRLTVVKCRFVALFKRDDPENYSVPLNLLCVWILP